MGNLYPQFNYCTTILPVAKPLAANESKNIS